MSTHTREYYSALKNPTKVSSHDTGFLLSSLNVSKDYVCVLLRHTSLKQHTGLRNPARAHGSPPATPAFSQLLQSSVLPRGLCTGCCLSCLWLSWIPAHHYLLWRAGPRPAVLSSDYPPLQAPRGDVCPCSWLQAGGAGDHTWFCPAPGTVPDALLA